MRRRQRADAPSVMPPATPTISSHETATLYKLLALAQWAALLLVPQLYWRPHWPAFLAWIGGERNASVYGNFLLTAATLLLGNLFFYAVYAARAPLFEDHKIQQEKPWPWEAHVPPQARAAFSKLVWQGVLLTLLNVSITIPLAAGSYPNLIKFGYSAKAEDFPSAWTMLWQLALFMIVEDTLFYWGHWTLHRPAIYQHIHKVHHAFTYSVSIAAVATHPVEYTVSNVIPFVAGPTVLGAHCATTYVWLIFRLSEGLLLPAPLRVCSAFLAPAR
jgi:sterol desaturase/sphingolipid hydroxylase (fatty acid hydroxylase superfamily)